MGTQKTGRAAVWYPQKPADWGDAPWLPSAVLHLMQQPVPTCTGKSIGFLPLNIREATPAEREARPELTGVPVIDKAVGIEYAVVPVPANPEAQMQAVAKGRELGLIDDGLEELICKSAESFAGPPDEPLANIIHDDPAIPFLRPGTLTKALERELSGLRPLLRTQVREQMREVMARTMGRV